MSAAHYTNRDPGRVSRLLPDLLRSRELLLDLVWKDVKVRYRYAAMGFLWAVLEPLFMMLVLTFVFSMVFRMEVPGLGVENGRHYAAFVLTGLIFWQFFSTALSAATRSLVDNRDLVKKVYFPREVIPLSAIGVSLVNLAIGFVLMLIVFTVLMGRLPLLGLLYVLPVFAIQLLLVVGLALLFSAANASFRDVAYMVDAALLFGFYATPVFYWISLVEERLPDWLYALYLANPMAGLIVSYRLALFNQTLPPAVFLLWPLIFALAAMTAGVLVFRRNAPRFADNL